MIFSDKIATINISKITMMKYEYSVLTILLVPTSDKNYRNLVKSVWYNFSLEHQVSIHLFLTFSRWSHHKGHRTATTHRQNYNKMFKVGVVTVYQSVANSQKCCYIFVPIER